jgi:hypothetical protein
VVESFCEDLHSDIDLAPLHDSLAARLQELRDPLRIAVAGHVSAGKSTLVNALIGRRLAETDRSETTKVNSWFVRGRPEKVIFQRVGGARVECHVPVGDEPLPVPSDLDRDAREPIKFILDEPVLEDTAVIDTPGLFSPTSENSDRTQDLLMASRTKDAAKAANALIYVTQEIPGSEQDDRQLAAFRGLFGGIAGWTPINAVLVLTKLDMYCRSDDLSTPFDLAQKLISAHGQELWRRVWTTTPLVGHFAELGRTQARLSRTEAADLEKLAAFEHRSRLLEVDAYFERAGVPLERGRALRTRLGDYGLRRALELLDAGSRPDDLFEQLAEESGLQELLAIIAEVFRRRADLLRAESVVSSLRRDALLRSGGLDAAAADKVLRSLDRILLSEHALPLRRVHVLRLVCDERGELGLSDRRRRELRRLFAEGAPAERLGASSDTDPRELAREARRRWEHWRARENSGVILPTLRTVAEVASQGYSELTRTFERQALSA